MRNRKLLLSLVLSFGVCAVFASGGEAYAEWKGNADSLAASSADATDASGKRYQKGRILVFPRTGLSSAQFDEALQGLNAKRLRRVARFNIHVVEVPEGDEERAVERLRKDRRFKSADLNLAFAPGAVPNDERYPSLWHLQKIGAPEAWDEATGEGVTIAIVDTGVDGTHPDLVARMVPGWNIYNNNSNTADVETHGTQVAGLAAATGNNGIGTTGVNWNANIMPIRVGFNNGAGTLAYEEHIAAGVQWAADHGARVANVSWRGVAGRMIMQTASNYMRSKGGAVLVCSDNTGNNPGYPVYDAFVTVGALTSGDARASYSSYGAHLDISAPGHQVTTTLPGGGYTTGFSGCSAATPVASGVYALMLSANPALTPAQLDNIVFETATDLGDAGRDDQFGHGRINAAAAVARAVELLPPTDNVPPDVTITSPGTGGQWTGLLNVDAAAIDNTVVAYVDLYLNGAKILTDSAAPYAFSVDTTLYPNGAATLEARAVDAVGNVGVSVPVAGSIFNDLSAPVVQFAAPQSGAIVSGTVNVRGSATDNIGVGRVELWRGETLIETQVGAPYRFKWNTAQSFNGPAQLKLRAYDAAGNIGQAMIAVTVSNSDTQAPTTSIVSPAGGATVSGLQVVEAKAGDNKGVERVELYFEGALIGTSVSSPYRFNWNTVLHPNGRGGLTTKAYDYLGNSKVSARRNVIVAN